jgi:hypothetical protein
MADATDPGPAPVAPRGPDAAPAQPARPVWVFATLALVVVAAGIAALWPTGPTGPGGGPGVTSDPQGDLAWTQTLGGSGDDMFVSVAAVHQGVVVAGLSEARDGDLIGGDGSREAVLARYDLDGNLVWTAAFGGTGYEGFHAVAAVDGGVVAVGYAEAHDGDLAGQDGGNRGEMDAVVARYDLDGNLVWAATFGGESYDGFYSVAPVDGGVVVAGASRSGDGDLPPLRGAGDAVLARYDLDGNLVWLATSGGAAFDGFESVAAVDGGVVAAGATGSNPSDALLVSYR